jgi:pimeloyl-ACP methyl ester carboxylesterase
MMRRTTALPLLLALCVALLAAACSGSSSAKDTTPDAASMAATASATPDAHDGWQTPITLPVTPVALPFENTDPKFDALPGARAIYGDYSGGVYEIEVPDNWNGDVVYFAHGFRGNQPQLVVQAPPIREHLIANGFAWAASSYSKNGYEPGDGARDTYALRDIVEEKIGAPKHNYLYGQSMGGHVAALSLELYPTAYDGAMAECGAVAGREILDYFVSWAALAEYYSGETLFTDDNDAGKLINALRSGVGSALGSPQSLTPKGDAFASAVEQLTGGPRPFFKEGFVVNYTLNFGLLVQAVAQPQISNAVAQNAGTTYAIGEGYGVTADALNRAVTRVQSNPAYMDRATYPENADLTGKIERPFLTIHGTGDLFVPISMEQSYRRKVDAAGAGDLLVQRAIRRAGHCVYSQDERIAAFDDLVSWVRDGKKPAGEDLLGDLSDAGRAFTKPLLDGDPGGEAIR